MVDGLTPAINLIGCARVSPRWFCGWMDGLPHACLTGCHWACVGVCVCDVLVLFAIVSVCRYVSVGIRVFSIWTIGQGVYVCLCGAFAGG